MAADTSQQRARNEIVSLLALGTDTSILIEP
jgi:hypothetical protein